VRYLLPILLVAAGALAVLVIDDGGGEAPRRAAPTATPEPVKVEIRDRPVPDVRRSRCPADVSGCRAVRGTVLYVESVDPDGDGDLHVVLDGGSITLPGMTAIDIAPDLRPRRDPHIGDRVSAAGPVQTGSYGQDQIHALELRVRRR
jgi:hypothetical protein